DGVARGFLGHDEFLPAVGPNAVEMAAEHDVVRDLEGEGELHGGSAVGEAVGLDAGRGLVSELVHIPDDGADQAEAVFRVVRELLGAAVGPGLQHRLLYDLEEGVLDGVTGGAVFVKVLESGGVETAEAKMNRGDFWSDPLDHGVVVFPRAGHCGGDGGSV